MSSSETSHRLKLFFLKHPKRLWLKFKQSNLIKPESVTIQLNNSQVSCKANQTVLEVAQQNKLRIPFNCRAGICGACETFINGKVEKACYTLVKEKMYVVEKSKEMSHWRQNMSDE
jgi:succinate dehydrogenase/fumarate reductase-like Fe-S protein